MDTVADRVARGAAWLDENYPNWVDSIDLAVLDLADCYLCMMGQVYTGVIPDTERNQIIAQVASKWGSETGKSKGYWIDTVASWGGFSILQDFHKLERGGIALGFQADLDEDGVMERDYEALLDEWTRVVIERRIQAHPDVAELTCRLDGLRVPATVS